MGCQDKIEDQESLNVFIQSLFSDADRLNVSKIFSKLNSCVAFCLKRPEPGTPLVSRCELSDFLF